LPRRLCERGFARRSRLHHRASRFAAAGKRASRLQSGAESGSVDGIPIRRRGHQRLLRDERLQHRAVSLLKLEQKAHGRFIVEGGSPRVSGGDGRGPRRRLAPMRHARAHLAVGDGLEALAGPVLELRARGSGRRPRVPATRHARRGSVRVQLDAVHAATAIRAISSSPTGKVPERRGFSGGGSPDPTAGG
jgi:hypothetical protein